MFKIEILVKGSTLKMWENVLESFLKLLQALDVDVEGGIVYDISKAKE